MGGTKKKSISQAEKAQQASTPQDKSKESSKQQRQEKRQPFMSKMDDKELVKTLAPVKFVTLYTVARTLGVNASLASSVIRSMESKNLLKKVGGYSGHYVYSLASA